MTTLRVILIIVIGVLLVWISIQNSSEFVSVRIIHKVYQKIPLSFVMLYSFAFGLLTVGIFALIQEVRLRRRIIEKNRECEGLLEELKALRNLPLGIEER